MRNKIFWMVVSLGVVAVFYLSWLPQPRLSSQWFMPAWLGKWTDAGANENLRTAVPFLFLGGISGLWLAKVKKPFRSWVIAFALLILVATIAEVGQLLIPQRTCDIGDILWGAAGSFVGLIGILFAEFIFKLFGNIGKINVPKEINTQYNKVSKKVSPQYGL